MVTLTSSVDELDARLIAALREDPRVGLLEISRRLGVARGTVQARLAKLEERGVIRGYGPEIDAAAIDHPIQAYVLLELTQGRLAEAIETLEGTPEILSVDAVSGLEDLICRVAAGDSEHVKRGHRNDRDHVHPCLILPPEHERRLCHRTSRLQEREPGDDSRPSRRVL